ncbi:TetR/AcrR family transcriptional regulator [Labedaea rhizosphaerae]|uniref:TetR family transcriptional regulator n=1 Tax=Labedaea rhizosphaerae TaxID=598644 RepID=A0A4R6SEH3_LABRH|nr:TetR/AcrR family transcriptional regulator [Labedaea rhizosphaerae]TDP98127.1 TetR family transcriptional regulator [Labedaea rhizosphaerae]
MAASPSTDPRVQRSREAILAAAVEVLSERGFEGATIEAVVVRSGVAKTTVYRQWPNRRDLLLSAVETAVPRAEIADTGSLAGDLKSFVRELVAVLNTEPAGRILPRLIAAAEDDAELARLLSEFTAQRRKPIETAVLRAVERGEPDAGARDSDTLASLVLGPLFYRRLLSRRTLTIEFAERVVDDVLARLSQRFP